MEKPLLVFFGLTDEFPEANERHYWFMLQGLKEVKNSLKGRGINFIIQQGSPVKGVINLAEEASLVVVDRGYLKIEQTWRKKVAEKIDSKLIQVETDIVVPVEQASDKEEYAARTIRPKIEEKIDKFLNLPEKRDLKIKNLKLKSDKSELNLSDISDIVSVLSIDHNIDRPR